MAKSYSPRECAECKEQYTPTSPRQSFCSVDCRKANQGSRPARKRKPARKRNPRKKPNVDTKPVPDPEVTGSPKDLLELVGYEVDEIETPRGILLLVH